MPSPSNLVLFCGAALALLLIPGPSVLFIVARSVEHGRRAGLVSVLGIHAGSVVHVIAAAAVGLSAVLMSSALAFSTVKYAGAAYLLWLGVRRWRTKSGPFHPIGTHDAAPAAPADLGRLFRQGFVVNLLNPKTALFFLAFLPSSWQRTVGTCPNRALVLGLTFIALGMVSDGAYALLASSLGRRLRRSRGP